MREDGPQPPIASSSSRRYLPPKVKSILPMGVEREIKKRTKGETSKERDRRVILES
jgi:hypothetical protein